MYEDVDVVVMGAEVFATIKPPSPQSVDLDNPDEEKHGATWQQLKATLKLPVAWRWHLGVMISLQNTTSTYSDGSK